MAGKQAKYLDGLLEDDLDQVGEQGPESGLSSAQAPERSRSFTLLHRESSLARSSSGDVDQITQHRLDPGRVRVWSGNARAYERLTEENTRELIESIIAEGGQKVPAIVRRIEGDPNHDFEVVAGTRRHFAISWLRAHNYPDFKFLAQAHLKLDDEAAFRLADLENRARKDVSDIERARNYAAALAEHYDNHVTRMADRLRVSKGWLSKMLKVARIPDHVIDAFSSPSDLQLKPAYGLAQKLDDKAAAKAVMTEARKISGEQASRREAGLPPYPAVSVMKRLMHVTSSSTQQELAYRASSSYGRDILSVQAMNRQGLTLRLHAGSGADREEIMSALSDLLDHVEAQGRLSLR